MRGFVSRLDQFDWTRRDSAPLPARDELIAIRSHFSRSLPPAGEEAARRAGRLIIGNYPRADVDDPAIYSTSIFVILSEYPQDVLDRLIDPRTGIPRTCKFLPRINEVADMCEAEIKRRPTYVLQAESLLREHDRRNSVAKADAAAISPIDMAVRRKQVAEVIAGLKAGKAAS
jgi:hypothetical protein